MALPGRSIGSATSALLIGYAEERRIITAEHVEAVCEELVTVVPE